MKFNKYAKTHYDWVDSMGWHNKNLLGSLALIGSEIGEASLEVLKPPYEENNLAEELADVCLRIIDLMYGYDMDIDNEVSSVAPTLKWNSKSIEGDLLELMVDFGHLVNSARYDTLDHKFTHYLASILARVIDIAEMNDMLLEQVLITKIEKNKARGNKGRKV